MQGSVIRPNVAVAIAILAELVAIVGGTLIRWRFPGTMTIPRVLVMTTWNLVFVALFAWLFLHVLRKPHEARSPPWHPLLLAAIVVVLAVLPLAGYGVDGDWEVRLAFFFLGIPVAAIGEELIYRAIIQTALEKIFHPIVAILLATGLFVLSHVGSQPIFDDAPVVTSIAATGVILGVIYQRTRNLGLVVMLHALFDWVLFVPKLHIIGPLTVAAGNIVALVVALIWWSLDRTRERVAV